MPQRGSRFSVMSKRVPQERACPFLWSSATIDAGGVHFKVLFGTCSRPCRFFRGGFGGFGVFTGVAVCFGHSVCLWYISMYRF